MDAPDVRVTAQVVRVLEAMLADVAADYYGFQLSGLTKLKSGTLYPILARLERAKWLESGWEDPAVGELGRPRRRYYRLSGEGVESARVTVAEWRSRHR